MSTSICLREGGNNSDPGFEEEVVTLDATDVKEKNEDCLKSLVGRIMADRSFSLGLIEGNDLLRVERGSPWLFKQYVIHVQRWNKDSELGAADFSIFPMWIQLWELPDFCKTKEAAMKVGLKIGSVLEADLFEMRPRDVQLMKVRVKVDVSHPLRQTIRVASPDKQCYEILLKYEKLGFFGAQVELKWRPDLKANQLGWRVTETKENTNPNWRGKGTSLNSSNKKPTPVSLLKSFASLSCKEKNNDTNSENVDSISSTPIMIDHTSNTAATLPMFQCGTNQGSNTKTPKRQKLKHLARRGNSRETLKGVIGVKRSITDPELGLDEVHSADINVSYAAMGKGANPNMAPQCQ
ncbi:hypothetical protein PIB30_064900 [Stylosanthes scabra]|uniref:DUF4283 domain-containing protein n=1 Tax=Stylosanthes scabra TaxID=79078 RepID=A0ABU6ZKJ0_9FABA|nr:hypothetical protein [Stylosanthes scabra]